MEKLRGNERLVGGYACVDLLVIGLGYVGLPVALGLGFGAGMGPRGVWGGFTAGLFTVATLLCGRFLWLSGRRIERIE